MKAFLTTLKGIVVVCLITGLVWLSLKNVFYFDWTYQARSKLRSASQLVLEQVPAELEIVAYVDEEHKAQKKVARFIRRYQYYKPDIQLQFINPDKVPDELRRYGVKEAGELVVKYQGRWENIKNLDEQSLTNAIKRLSRGHEKWLVFVEGHGERSLLGVANHDLGEWGQVLEQSGLRLQPLNLATGMIPDNTSALVIASPRVGYLPTEIDKILAYVKQGGNLLWLVDPGSIHGMSRLAQYLGIEFYSGVLIDPAGSFIGIDDPTIVVATERLYPPHLITEDFSLTTLFFHVMAMKINPQADWQHRTIVESGKNTWVETAEGKPSDKLNLSADKIPSKTLGPLSFGVTLERGLAQNEDVPGKHLQRQRIAVIGDGDFLSNQYLGNGGNLDFGQRLINWLTQDDALITIPVRVSPDRQVNLSNNWSGVLGVFFLIGLPIGLFIVGVVLIRRRKCA